MSNGQRTNEQLVRAREGGVLVTTNQYMRAELLVDWKSDPDMAPLVQRYPAFGVALADYFVRQLRQDEDIKPEQIGYLAAQFGVPRTAMPFLFSSGRGGRSQADIENTVRSYQVSISNRAKVLGINLNAPEVDYIARVAEAQNYSAEQVDAALTGLIKWDSLQGGTLTAARDSINTLAKDYLVSFTDDLVRDWSTRLATGAATTEGFKSVVMAQAKLQNPWLATYIDQGLSPNELLDPGRRQIATSLGLNPAEIDFSDPTNMNLVTTKDDKGNTRLATIPEIRTNIRMDPRWEATDEARQTAASMARLLSEVFGRSAF